MRIKEKVVYITIFLVLGLSYAIFSNAASSKLAAKVNNTSIENVTLEAAMDNFIENQKMFGIEIKEEQKDGLRKEILNELISAELLYQESKKAGLGDMDMDKEIEGQFEKIKKGFASEKEFKNVLKERGITAKQLKEDIRKGVYIRVFLDRDVYNKIGIDEGEKREEYEKNKDKLEVPEQVRASHILIRLAEDASDEDKAGARAKIEELREKALSGEDFTELAKENSEDGSASVGGDLGYFKRGDMVKPFEEVAFTLENEEISDVIETQFGYHIVKLIDKRAPHKLTYEEVEGEIEKFLLGRYRQEELNKFVDGLKKTAKIEIYID